MLLEDMTGQCVYSQLYTANKEKVLKLYLEVAVFVLIVDDITPWSRTY